MSTANGGEETKENEERSHSKAATQQAQKGAPPNTALLPQAKIYPVEDVPVEDPLENETVNIDSS